MTTTNPARDFRIEPAHKAEVIAERSTRGLAAQRKARWTEVRVHFLHNPGPDGVRFVSETRGCSALPGERTLTRLFASSSLERALADLADDDGRYTPFSRAVCDIARTWAERHSVGAETAAVEALIAWARQEQASPAGGDAFSMGGHIDENHRYKLRDMVEAIDSARAVAA